MAIPSSRLEAVTPEERCKLDAEFLRDLAMEYEVRELVGEAATVIASELNRIADQLEATGIIAGSFGEGKRVYESPEATLVEQCYRCEGTPFTCNVCPGTRL